MKSLSSPTKKRPAHEKTIHSILVTSSESVIRLDDDDLANPAIRWEKFIGALVESKTGAIAQLNKGLLFKGYKDCLIAAVPRVRVFAEDQIIIATCFLVHQMRSEVIHIFNGFGSRVGMRHVNDFFKQWEKGSAEGKARQRLTTDINLLREWLGDEEYQEWSMTRQEFGPHDYGGLSVSIDELPDELRETLSRFRDHVAVRYE